MNTSIRSLFISLLVFIGQINLAEATNVEPASSKVVLKTVTFFAGQTINSDKNIPYAGPHWVDEKDNKDPDKAKPDGQPDLMPEAAIPADKKKNYPYSYGALQVPEIEAVFHLCESDVEMPLYGEAEVINSEGSSFKLRKKKLDGLKYSRKAADKEIVDSQMIRAFMSANRGKAWDNDDPLTLSWKVYDKNQKLVGGGVSKHTIYVSWDVPTTELRQETLFITGTREPDVQNVQVVQGEGANKGANVAKEIFKDFEDRKVIRIYDEKPMTYWNRQNPYPAGTLNDVSKLLSEGDGPCGRWGFFFKETTLIHGLQLVSTKLITPRPKKATINGMNLVPVKSTMMVKEWVTTLANLPARVTPGTLNRKPGTVNKPNTKKPAQGHDNPFDLFTEHCVIALGQSLIIYDPSYGTKTDGQGNALFHLEKWANSSISFINRKYAVNNSSVIILFDPANVNVELSIQ